MKNQTVLWCVSSSFQRPDNKENEKIPLVEKYIVKRVDIKKGTFKGLLTLGQAMVISADASFELYCADTSGLPNFNTQ